MQNTLLSIIIPVYNVEKYLVECLDSVFCQNLENCEVICVNDGSTDRSGEILKKYNSFNQNLRLIEKENGGLVSARNAGYKIAKGKYIFYLDSDDFLLEGVISKMLDFTIKNDLDLSLFNALKNGETNYFTLQKEFNTEMKGIEFFREFQNSNNFFPPSVQWLYLYRKSFLDENHISFPPDNLQEDEPFTIKSFFHANKVAVLDIPIVYHRVFRPGSITQQASLPHLFDARVAWDRLLKFLIKQKCRESSFFHKIFSLYQSTISKLMIIDPECRGKDFFSQEDFKNMRYCVLDTLMYKYYWYYRQGNIMFNWYQNGKRLILLKKMINRCLNIQFHLMK